MKFSTYKAIILLVAMGLTMMSANFDVACCETSDSDDGSSDILVAYSCDDSASEKEDGHENGHCCESGCHDCSLPCCAGSAMITTTTQLVGPILQLDGRLVITTAEESWVDPDRLFHPPRA